jgi:hypothetical protein
MLQVGADLQQNKGGMLQIWEGRSSPPPPFLPRRRSWHLAPPHLVSVS